MGHFLGGKHNIKSHCKFILLYLHAGTFITRTCLLNGVWNDVDFTSCTLESVLSEPFLIVYYTLNDSQANSSTGSVKKRAVEILKVSDHQTILAEVNCKHCTLSVLIIERLCNLYEHIKASWKSRYRNLLYHWSKQTIEQKGSMYER